MQAGRACAGAVVTAAITAGVALCGTPSDAPAVEFNAAEWAHETADFGCRPAALGNPWSGCPLGQGLSQIQ